MVTRSPIWLDLRWVAANLFSERLESPEYMLRSGVSQVGLRQASVKFRADQSCLQPFKQNLGTLLADL